MTASFDQHLADQLDDIKQSRGVQAAMRGIRCGVLGMIGVAALIILHTTLPTWPGVVSGELCTITPSAK